MNYTTADPTSRYQEFHTRVDRELQYLGHLQRGSRRTSKTVRTLVLMFLFSASVLPLMSQLPQLSWLPPWTSTFAIVIAGGLIMLDRSAMWTADFLRVTARLIRTMSFKDDFDSKHALLVRLAGQSPSAEDDAKLLEHLDGAFHELNVIQREEAQQWASQFSGVLANLEKKALGKERTAEQQLSSET